jgi:DeoR/GlpR family transcriptional regulator of sugar metabolism
LANFRVDIAFIAIDGFAEDGSPTGRSRGLAQLKGQMILSGPAYLIAEHTAFRHLTPFRILNADKVTGIIVDQEPGEALVAAWTDSGCKVIVASQENQGDSTRDQCSSSN